MAEIYDDKDRAEEEARKDNSKSLWAIAAVAAVAAIIAAVWLVPMWTRPAVVERTPVITAPGTVPGETTVVETMPVQQQQQELGQGVLVVEQQPPAGVEPMTTLQPLTQPTNIEMLTGRRIEVRNAPITHVENDRMFWIGQAPQQDVLVVMADAGAIAGLNLGAGDMVNLLGTVRATPDAAQMRTQWGLTDDRMSRVHDAQIYLSAEQVERFRN
jgi:hypothetical protein